MQCNINAKGKAVRLLSGLSFILAAVLTLLVGGLEGIPLIVGISLLIGGGYPTLTATGQWIIARTR